MSIETVRTYLETYGVADRIREFSVSSATVELAAQALGVEGARIAKTLSFYTGEGCMLLVTAGDAKVDNQKYKAQFGCKAKMLTFEDVEPMTGHPVGGVCPFAVGSAVPIYLDVSLQRFSTVFPAVGTPASAIELTCAELQRYSGAVAWVDVCKDWGTTD